MSLLTRSVFTLALGAVVFSPASKADSAAIVGELKNCARIAVSDARMSCYEALGRRVIQNEASMPASANPAPGSTTAPATAVVTDTTPEAVLTEATSSEPRGMSDTMGGYQYAAKSSDHPDNDVHARVIQCQQDRDKVWFFKFDNGQVWKQVDRSTRHFKDCDFAVVLSKDGFGYKMQVEGKGAKVRISRRK